MKVVMTKKELLEKGAALSKVIQGQVEFKLAYRLGKIAKKVLAHVDRIEKQRIAWVNEMGEKQEDGTMKVVKRLPEFQALYEKLLGEEVELEYEQIPRAMMEKVQVSAVELMGIDDFITPEEENTPE